MYENKLDIVIESGADFGMTFWITDNNEQIVDLTDAIVEARLRQFAEANDFFPFTVTHGGVNGRVKISMPHEMTAIIPYTAGVYDVKITFKNGSVRKPFYGEAYINPEITRPYDGTILNIISVGKLEDLPEIGQIDRLYYIHETDEFYRWNGTEYVTAAEPNSIVAVEKIGSQGLVDTYRIYFSNGNTSEFFVTNGTEGPQGPRGPQGPAGPAGNDGNGYYHYDPETELITMINTIPYSEVLNQKGGYTAIIGF